MKTIKKINKFKKLDQNIKKTWKILKEFYILSIILIKFVDKYYNNLLVINYKIKKHKTLLYKKYYLNLFY